MAGRWYTDPTTGLRVPSVTTILNEMSKPGLPLWAARLAVESGDPYASKLYVERAGAQGQRVHAAIHSGRWRGLVRFQRALSALWESRPFEILSYEQTVWSAQHRYAGTYDMTVRFFDTDEVEMVDVKTNEKGPYLDSVRLQLAGYRYADSAPVVDGTSVLWLRPGHAEWIDADVERRDFEVFLKYRHIYDYRRETGRAS